MDILQNFSFYQIMTIGLLFIWTGFVRSGLGFGGAALGLPLLLFVHDQAIFWMPIIGLHLLFFSALTLRTRIHKVDTAYLKKAMLVILPFTLIGIAGLITLPTHWLLSFIYGVALCYSLLWLFDIAIKSRGQLLDHSLLAIGGYVAGTSLTGAPLIAAVFISNVSAPLLRNTLFVTWFVIVSLKLSVFLAIGVDLQWQTAILLLPVAAIGHFVGLKAHEYILQNTILFKRVIGFVLALISLLGLLKVWWL